MTILGTSVLEREQEPVVTCDSELVLGPWSRVWEEMLQVS